MPPPEIRRLPDAVIDQIAAGEVIERPASVVKELIDNALDAGATTITVELEAGGRGALRVVDDGVGMAPADVALALTRHATSKLRTAADLVGITTMGFRGEALPAIASVARVTITTRRADADHAWRVELDGGRVTSEGPAGAPIGTSIAVRDLFYTVPARLKFLKSDATETSHIVDAVARIAMAQPTRHLRLVSAGRVLLDTPIARAPIDRVRALLGGRIGSELVEVSGEENGVRVHGFLAAPETAQTTARGVQLFVGHRPVRDRGLLHAIGMAYGELVPRGRYPVAVVLLDVPGPGLDVNVHPQKAEVRFGDAAMVQAAVRHVLRRGVATAPWAGRGGAALVQMTAVTSVAPPPPTRDLAAGYASAVTQQRLGRGAVVRTRGDVAQVAMDLGAGAASAWSQRLREALAARERPLERVGMTPPAVVPATPPLALAPTAPVAPGFFAGLRFLGQLDQTYLACEGDGELVLIDQHVAHERVVLHGLRRSATGVAVQRLLFPTEVTLPAALRAIVQAQAETLARLGFEVAVVGEQVRLAAMPAGLRQDPAVVLRDLAEHLGDDAAAARSDRPLATIACHTAMRAGDPLTAAEAGGLLAAMDTVDFHEPGLHGRPVLLRLSVAEIGRRFGR